MAFCFVNKLQAQTTTADSVLTVTDTSITTPNNIVVTDSSGNTTLFAGGQQSDFAGKVGVGTNKPSNKFTIYDSKDASFRLSQSVTDPAAGQQKSISSSSGEVIRNFEIDILREPLPGDYRQIGDVVLSSYGGEAKPNINNLKVRPSIYDPINLGPIGCAYSMHGAMSFESVDYGWMTYELDAQGCPTQAENLQLFLSNSGDLALYNGSFAVQDLFKVNKNDGITYAKEIKVQAIPFPPDFVFNKDYKMMDLHDLEQYVNTNHHLPEIPSAAEQTTNGINVAEMQGKLLQKIEELTLYMIELKKQNDNLQQQVNTLKTK